MSELTTFLSQLIGPVLLLMGLSIGLNRKYYSDWMRKIDKHEACLFFMAITEVTIGLAIVLSHNLWGTIEEVVITVVGYGAILEGAVVLIGGKSYVKGIMKKLSPDLITIAVICCLVVGAYISWNGFFA
jgi:hypothetical protein